MRRAERVAALILFSVPAAAAAETRIGIAIPAGPLDAGLAALAEQAHVDVGSGEAGLARVRAPRVRGQMTAARALDRLLAETPFRAVRIGANAFRIVRAPARRARAVMPVAAPVAPDPAELVVTGSKRNARLFRFPGSVAILRPPAGPGGGLTNMADAAVGVATLQSTALGAGRDKLFVRGIADSSFIGPTQSATSVYFGEAPLGYNGPDPNLDLYDLAGIEILAGPQGTLYGAGAIGGVIRLTPNPPDPARFAAGATVGVTLTEQAAAGEDVAAMLNLPLLDARAAVRIVGYRSSQGGYIDDVRRGLTDINRTRTLGGRATVRALPGDGWTIDFGLLGQTISAPDSQYAQRGLPGLARAAAIAQPFEDDYALGQLVAAKTFDSGVRLLSATGYVDHHADDRYDASVLRGGRGPLAFDTHTHNRLLTHELRLSRTDGDNGWLIGSALLSDRDRVSRALTRPGTSFDLVGVTNRTLSLAVFGEVTRAVAPNVAITAGARVTRSRTDGSPSIVAAGARFIRGRTDVRLDPMAALSWRVAPHLAVYARYQTGYRTAGLAVAPGVGRVADYSADTIGVAEAGLRLERQGARGLAGSAGVSYARWRKIQADLIDARGFPFTANVGDGRIVGLEAAADWVPLAGLHVTGSLFAANSRLTDRADRLAPARARRLPDTPRLSANLGVDRRWTVGGGELRLGANARYVGSSVLDSGQLLDIRQGGYGELGLDAGWRRAAWDLTLRLANATNTKGDRFALGNPFGVAMRDQFTPLRPRNLRIGMEVRW